MSPGQPNTPPAFIVHSVPVCASKTRATAEGGGKECHSCKPLPNEFRRDGFAYRQIVREGNAAIYQQTWTGCGNPSVAYEVVRFRRREGFQIHRKFVEPYEIYPAAKDWGTAAFTVINREAAFARLREMATTA